MKVLAITFKGKGYVSVGDPGLRWGGPRCKMFSHGPMSGAGGAKVLFGTYSHTRKVQNWDQGVWPPCPPGSAAAYTLTEPKLSDES